MRALPGQIKSVTRILQPFLMPLPWCGVVLCGTSINFGVVTSIRPSLHIWQFPWNSLVQSVTINSQSHPSLALCLWKHPRTCLEQDFWCMSSSVFSFPIKITGTRSMMILVANNASIMPMTTSLLHHLMGCKLYAALWSLKDKRWQ